MPKKLQRTASESSDDEAPEAVSFGSSKKSAKGERDAVEQFNASEKLKRKEKNRAIDHALKERSTSSKGKGKARDLGKNVAASDEEDGEESDQGEGEGGPSRRDLEARMARAMMEADEEDDEEDGSAFEGFSGEEDVEMEGGEDQSEDDDMVDGEEAFDEDEDEEETEQDVDDEMGAGSEEDEDENEDGVPTKPPTSSKRNYLPDHLFKSALSNTPSKGSKIVFDDTSRPSPPPSKQQKRKRTKGSPKDILLGSRTIRTLPKANSISVKGLSRPRRVEKFARSSINLKGDPLKSRTKGWTRKSANLGVMKRSGPAANFVRNA